MNASLRLFCLTMLVSACIRRPSFMQPAPARHWPNTYVSAQLSADQGRYDESDRVLVDFVRDYPGSPEAQECGYWRAVYKLDPANRNANTRDALAGLDAYVAASRAGVHRGEATTLRRLAQKLVAVDRALAAQPGDARDKPRDEDVQKLREELQATKEELEMIKRRLAAPKP